MSVAPNCDARAAAGSPLDGLGRQGRVSFPSASTCKPVRLLGPGKKPRGTEGGGGWPRGNHACGVPRGREESRWGGRDAPTRKARQRLKTTGAGLFQLAKKPPRDCSKPRGQRWARRRRAARELLARQTIKQVRRRIVPAREKMPPPDGSGGSLGSKACRQIPRREGDASSGTRL